MISYRNMFISHLIAVEPPAGGWAPWISGGVGTGLLAGWQYLLSRRAEAEKRREARRDAREDKNEEGAASVELGYMQSLAELQRQRDKLQDQRSKEYSELRGEMIRHQEKSEARINLLDSRVQILSNAYHQLHSVTILFQQNWRSMKARLKRADPNFDPDEYPDIDMSHLNPREVFAEINRPVSVTVFSSPTDPRKTTTVVTTGTSTSPPPSPLSPSSSPSPSDVSP